MGQLFTADFGRHSLRPHVGQGREQIAWHDYPAFAAGISPHFSVELGDRLGLRIADQLKQSGFASRFVAKGRFKKLMETIPVKCITYAQPGLYGAAAAFAQKHAR